MKKDFWKWHKRKTYINNDIEKRLFFHEREIWWCAVGQNIGFEQDGKGSNFARPILIFKKFNNEVCWAIPISTKIKKSKFYADLDLHDNLKRVAILSQLRLIDTKRLISKMSVLSETEYMKIQKAVISLCNS